MTLDEAIINYRKACEADVKAGAVLEKATKKKEVTRRAVSFARDDLREAERNVRAGNFISLRVDNVDTRGRTLVGA